MKVSPLMVEASMKWQSNWIGRLLGRDEIWFQDGLLADARKGSRHDAVAISECRQFATFRNGIFGGVLTIDIGGKRVIYRFLKNSGAAQFVDILNQSITGHLTHHLTGKCDEFKLHVIHAYPRDSRLAQLSRLCGTLSAHYRAQSDLWHRHLPPGLVQNVEDIVRFHPVDAQVLRDYHERIQLEQRSAFFDRVESNPLTLEQRLGVLRSNDNNMVLAAAGTGKTSVMVAKALDLIDRGLAQPEEILVLAYNRSAAEELRERLAHNAGKAGIALRGGPQISTFHALGKKLLREAGAATHLSVFTEDDIKLKQWITSWLEDYLTADNDALLDFIGLFPQPANPFDFATLADYEGYVRDNEFRTLAGEKVRGYQELLIANAMYLNGVPYTYEAPYVSKRRIDIGYDYRPDFQIGDTGIYIEHFGIDRQGGTAPGIDAVKYNGSMRSKRDLHAECGTVLIETFHYEWVEGSLIAGLKERLVAHGIVFHPLAPEAVLQQLREQGRIADWSELFGKALQALRVERLDRAAVSRRLEQAGIARARELTDLLSALQQDYAQELARQNAIDFDDMIIRAIQLVESGAYRPEWKYILVDEFQDISGARMDFVSAIIDKGPQPSLTVVGDDWQSIYRFSGGKLELTTRFGEKVGNYTATSLQKTFRYNDSIAGTAGKFIMENPEQYKKQIDTHTMVERSQVYLLDDMGGKGGGIHERIEQVVEKIRENDVDGSIAVIARYNYLLHDAKEALTGARLQTNVRFWTFHKSKGLEADYCILIGFFQGSNGFPNENRNDALLEALLPSLDAYPHSEERRLLYVGMTRARKKLYIIASPTAPSDFVTELLAPKYNLNIVSTAFREQYRKTFKCPHCETGYLRAVEGQFGPFYACSTGLGCQVGKARVCARCGAPSIDGQHASICNNPACGNTMKICERCGRPMKLRNGPRGAFWGCSGYGIQEDQCRHTEQYQAAA